MRWLALALAIAASACTASARQLPSLRRRVELDASGPLAGARAGARPELGRLAAAPELVLRARGGKGGAGIMPVHRKEFPMFFTFASMMFCTIFIFTMARDTKDTLVVTSAGAEAIAFLKVYFVIPASMLFFLLYAKMSSVLSKRVLFVSTMLPFIAFYALFGCEPRPPKRAPARRAARGARSRPAPPSPRAPLRAGSCSTRCATRSTCPSL